MTSKRKNYGHYQHNYEKNSFLEDDQRNNAWKMIPISWAERWNTHTLQSKRSDGSQWKNNCTDHLIEQNVTIMICVHHLASHLFITVKSISISGKRAFFDSYFLWKYKWKIVHTLQCTVIVWWIPLSNKILRQIVMGSWLSDFDMKRANPVINYSILSDLNHVQTALQRDACNVHRLLKAFTGP